jgi:hypothetical protein
MERRSSSSLEWLIVLTLLAAPLAHADESQPEIMRDIGAVLGWRLGPETLEERCRTTDPDGAEVRRKALQQWLTKNAALIRQVDSLVAEVVPILFKGEPGADPVSDVRAQVRTMLLESISPNDDALAMQKLCKSERDAQSSSWNSNGLPFVAESLAALYDWKVNHTPH